MNLLDSDAYWEFYSQYYEDARSLDLTAETFESRSVALSRALEQAGLHSPRAILNVESILHPRGPPVKPYRPRVVKPTRRARLRSFLTNIKAPRIRWRVDFTVIWGKSQPRS